MTRGWTVVWTRLAPAAVVVLIGLRLLLPWHTLRQIRATQGELAEAVLAAQQPKPPSFEFGLPQVPPTVSTPARGPWQEQVEIMLDRIDAIDPEPLGLRHDGVFNEPFDDYPSFAEKGLATDAHDSIGKLRESFVATAASATIGETQYGHLREFGPGALSDLRVDVSRLPSAKEIIARKERCVSIAGSLIHMELKARCAQFLGLVDLLIGVTAIALLAGCVAWSAARPRGSQVLQAG